MNKRPKYEFDNDNKNAFVVGVILCSVAVIFGLQIRFDMLDAWHGPLFNIVGAIGAIMILGAGALLLIEYIEYKMYDEEDSPKDKETDSGGTMEDIDH
mgnify:CR=1 FL=1